MEGIVGFFKIEVAEWLDEAASRAHRARDARGFTRFGDGGFRDADGGGVEFLDAVFEAVMVEFQAARAERVRLDDGRASGEVLEVDVFHDVRRDDVHLLRAGTRLQAAGLQHCAHGAVKKINHKGGSFRYVRYGGWFEGLFVLEEILRGSGGSPGWGAEGRLGREGNQMRKSEASTVY